MITQTLSIVAAILGIYQFATKGKEMTIRFGKRKIDNYNGFEVY